MDIPHSRFPAMYPSPSMGQMPRKSSESGRSWYLTLPQPLDLTWPLHHLLVHTHRHLTAVGPDPQCHQLRSLHMHTPTIPKAHNVGNIS